MGVLRECPKCKKTYGGSMVGAMAHHANPKDKVGYFGGYCRCGEKLNESYDIEGIEIVEGDLNETKRVYASESLKWKKSLSLAEYRKVFGGLPKETICRFNYEEKFLAKNQEEAKEKFLNLIKVLRKQLIGKARLSLARLYGEKWTEDKEVWMADYTLQSARSPESICDYLELKRLNLNIVRRKH